MDAESYSPEEHLSFEAFETFQEVWKLRDGARPVRTSVVSPPDFYFKTRRVKEQRYPEKALVWLYEFTEHVSEFNTMGVRARSFRWYVNITNKIVYRCEIQELFL